MTALAEPAVIATGIDVVPATPRLGFVLAHGGREITRDELVDALDIVHWPLPPGNRYFVRQHAEATASALEQGRRR